MVDRRGPRPRTIAAWTGGLTAAVLFVTGAAVAQGYDAEDLPTIESNVWVSRDASGGQYAKVNTDIAEIAAVHAAQGLAGIAQSGSSAFVFGSGHAKYWPLDPAVPFDISAEDAPSADQRGAGSAGPGVESPVGTTGRLAVGPYLLFTGPSPSWALAAELGDEEPSIRALDPYVGLPAPAPGARYAAAVSSMSAGGRVAMYSTQVAERRIVVVDTGSQEWVTAAIVDAPETSTGLQLSFVGDTWVLFAASGGGASRLWVEGRAEPILLSGIGGEGLLQSPGAASDTVAIAHAGGLALVDLGGRAVESVAASGTPARPTAFGDRLAAAWLTSSGGTLWTSGGAGTVPLEIDGGAFEQNVDVAPTIASNGGRAVLVESTTGMLWSVPDGVLIPLAAWTAGDPPPRQGAVEVPDASSQEPPVAESDAFGVRAGAISMLPVLFNDHDANSSDVLSIDPTSIEGLDPAFGSVALVGNEQSLIVEATGAVESASFTYRVTDGTASSPPATVTLRLASGNAAPVWCEDWVSPSCFMTWPSPEVAIGGTVRVDVLTGWVDPDGDPFVLASAVPLDGAPLVAMPGADGSLAIGHLEDRGGPGTYVVEVRLMDSRGAISEPRELVVTVEPVPGFAVTNGMVIGRADEWTRIAIDDFAEGGSGTYRIADAVDISSTLGGLDVEWNAAGGTLDVRAAEGGSHLLSVVVVDAATQNQRTVTLRYQVTDPALASVTLPPLTAFVRPGEDTVVDVLSAASNTTGRVLLLTNAVADSGALAAAVIDETSVQVRSTDGGRSEGPIGTIRLTATTTHGRTASGALTVFLVAPAAGTQPIALNDAAAVRAGEVIDIPVLDNDVAPRGERIALHPEVSGSSAAGELAFASGSLLRYRAPEVPGIYTVFYYALLPSSPTLLSRAQVTIQVLAPGANRAPQARDLEARLLAGRSVEIPIELESIDPDGDQVVVTGVTQPSRPELGAVMIGADGRSLLFTAPEMNPNQPTPGWQADFEYTVRDAGGATDTAAVRVGVSVQDFAEVTPIVFTDHVQVRAGTTGPITVEPLRNDRDPALSSLVGRADRGTGLKIIDLRPAMSGLAEDPASPYSAAAALLVAPTGPTTATETQSPDPYPDGVVGFRLPPDTLPGTYVYLYTVESRQTTSTAQALIVLTVTESQSPDRPAIRDTIVTAADRGRVAGGGIDVLAGKVTWATGDTGALAGSLALAPGAPAGFSVRPGTARIQGPLPPEGAVVPFQVSGTDSTGTAFTTYGFLRIPAFEDLRLAVATKPEPIPEEFSGEIDLSEVLAIGDTDVVEVSPDSPFVVHRPDSSCEFVGGSVIRYRAGYFPMFTDTCTVVARLAGQSDAAWSTVVVPIDIEPKDPLAILTPATLTLSITQAPVRIDFYDSLVRWYGNRALSPLSDLEFTWEYSGTQFEVVPRAGVGAGPDQAVTVQALADSRSGTRESIRVGVRYTTVDGFAFDEVVNVVLYVGIAPPEQPSGANLTLNCSTKTDTAGCQITAILAQDISGQFNPVRTAAGDTRLRLVGVGGGTSQSYVCTGVATVAVQADVLRFTWLPSDDPAKPFGGQCTVPFTVEDAQGRTGQGQVAFSADGFPQRPSTPVTSAYGPDWVDIDVPLGSATNAFPAVTSVRLLSGTAEVANQSCVRLDAGAFRCRVSGLTNGVQHTWQAATTNAVGESVPTAMQWPTNAYLAPAFTAGPVYFTRQFQAGVTTPSAGILLVHEACADSDAERIRFTITDANTTRTVTKALGAGGCVPADSDFEGITPAPGGVQVTATPISQFTPPRIGSVAGAGEGGSDTQSVVVRGAPSVAAFTVTPNAARTSVSVSATIDRRAGDGTQRVAFLAWAAGQPGTTPPSCVAASDGATSDGGTPFVGNSFAVVPGAGTARHESPAGTSAVFAVDGSATGLTPNLRYSFKVCVTTGYGWAEQAATPIWLFQDPGAPTASDLTYTPQANPSTMNSTYLTAPAPGADGPSFVWTVPNSDPTNNAATDFAAQLAGVAASSPAPPGSSWAVRYAVSPSGPFTRTSIDDNSSTFHAAFCFTADGEDFCSSPSAAITPEPGTNVGLDPEGGSASITLPTAAICVAARDGMNAQVAAAGDAAVAARVASLAEAQGIAARDAAYSALQSASNYVAFSDAVSGWGRPAGTTYDDSYGSIDAGHVAAFLSGVTVSGTAYPGYDSAYAAHLAATPGDVAGAAAAGRTAGAIAAERYATAVGQAAYTSARDAGLPGGANHGANVSTAEGEGVRINGSGSTPGELGRYTELSSSAAATPALQPVLSGFLIQPFQLGPAITVDADDATRRFGAVHYDFGPSVASSSSMSYVRTAVLADLPTHSCG